MNLLGLQEIWRAEGLDSKTGNRDQWSGVSKNNGTLNPHLSSEMPTLASKLAGDPGVVGHPAIAEKQSYSYSSSSTP